MPRTAQGHFSPALFQFLRQLERNNRRDWFEKNKSRYIEDVKEPMLRFIADFGPRLRKISPHFVADPSPVGGSMFRIYRDVRFAKDKRPYKTAATARFPHERGKDVHTPGWYLHLAPDGVYVGSGIWQPDAPALTRIRQTIVVDDAAWKRVRTNRKMLAVHSLSGDSLKRPPRGFDPGHPFVEDLMRKDFVTFAELDEKAACEPKFIDEVTDLCRAGLPLVRFLCGALEVPC
jgi:uncharacterized protein (TIGR02453 family)